MITDILSHRHSQIPTFFGLIKYFHLGKYYSIRVSLCNSSWLSWNLLCSPGWPWPHRVPLVSASLELESKVCATMPKSFLYFFFHLNTAWHISSSLLLASSYVKIFPFSIFVCHHAQVLSLFLMMCPQNLKLYAKLETLCYIYNFTRLQDEQMYTWL